MWTAAAKLPLCLSAGAALLSSVPSAPKKMGSIAVNFSSILNLVHQDDPLFVVYGVNNSAVALAHAVWTRTRQLLASGWTWITHQGLQSLLNPAPIFGGYARRRSSSTLAFKNSL
ncbi:MAG: hypothetical protein ACRD5W_14355 [Candidatus Acidiferrales bacterium]